MSKMLIPMLLPLLLLLLLDVAVPVSSADVSFQVISYKTSRKIQNGPMMCALDVANKTMSSSSLQDCSLGCARDDTCKSFNIKNLLTCDHVISPVLASTSRTHSPVRYTTLIRGSTHLSQNARSTRYVGCLVTGFLLSNILRFINSYAIFIPSSFLMYFRHLYLMKCTELFLYVYYWIYCSK